MSIDVETSIFFRAGTFISAFQPKFSQYGIQVPLNTLKMAKILHLVTFPKNSNIDRNIVNTEN